MGKLSKEDLRGKEFFIVDMAGDPVGVAKGHLAADEFNKLWVSFWVNPDPVLDGEIQHIWAVFSPDGRSLNYCGPEQVPGSVPLTMNVP